MLQLGRLSRRGPDGAERDSRFMPAEAKTHVTRMAKHRFIYCYRTSVLTARAQLKMSGPDKSSENLIKIFIR